MREKRREGGRERDKGVSRRTGQSSRVALSPPAAFVAVGDSDPAALHEVVVHQHQVVHEGKSAGSRASGSGDDVVQCGVHSDG